MINSENCIEDATKKEVDVEKELEELPSLISYREKLLEDSILKVEERKNNKNEKVAKFVLDNMDKPTDLRKALQKQLSASLDKDILEAKTELSNNKVELNKLKNRFQSVRKIASMRIEEMKHGL